MSLLVCALFLMGYAAFAPASASTAVRKALGLLSGAVIPNLIVFSVATKIFIFSGAVSLLQKRFPKCVLRFFGTSAAGLCSFFTGAVAGFPVGAVTLSDMVSQGEMTGEEASSLLPFCNNAGLAFLVGTVGEAFFHSTDLGWLLFAAQTAASFFALALTADERIPYLPSPTRKAPASPPCSSATHPRKSPPSAPRSPIGILTAAVAGGTAAMLAVCGYVIFFSVLSEAAGALLSWLPAPIFALFSGILELSGGLFRLAAAGAPPQTTMLLTAVALGFGGISVMMQAFDAAEKGGIATRFYLRGKLITALFCPLFVLLFHNMASKSISFPILFAVICAVTLMLLIKKRKNPLFLKKGVEKRERM